MKVYELNKILELLIKADKGLYDIMITVGDSRDLVEKVEKIKNFDNNIGFIELKTINDLTWHKEITNSNLERTEDDLK